MSIHRVAGRRAFLAGGAAIVALPFLESLELRSASAQTPPLPRRLIYYYVPNGIHMATFKPTAAGAGYPTPAMLMPLEALKSDFSVVIGIGKRAGQARRSRRPRVRHVVVHHLRARAQVGNDDPARDLGRSGGGEGDWLGDPASRRCSSG